MLSLDVRVLQSLRRIIRAVEIHSRRLAAGHRITGPQLVCLLALRDDGPLTTSGLARRVHLSASTVVGILDRLEERGLVRRERDRVDRRRVNVSVTSSGRTLADHAPSPLQDTLSTALQALPEHEQRAIARSLERIVGLMEADRIEAAPLLETGPLNPPDRQPPALQVSADQEVESESPKPVGRLAKQTALPDRNRS